MLKQPAVKPALGTADSLHTEIIHEVCSGGAGETVGIAAGRWLITEPERQAQGLETVHKPLARLAVGLATLSWG